MAVFSEMHEPGPYLFGKAPSIAQVHVVRRAAASSHLPRMRYSPLLFCNKSSASGLLNAGCQQKGPPMKLELHHISLTPEPLTQTSLITFVCSLVSPTLIR